MHKHTPGPWRVGNSSPLIFGAERGLGMEPLGFVYGPSDPERSEVGHRAMADTRLAAAAPDLLTALGALLSVYSGPDRAVCCDGRDCGCMGASAYQEAEYYARAAIAKATGVSP